MNKIESEIKLDFHNVLIRPKRTTLNSRSEIELDRTFKFKYSNLEWYGKPIIAANMSTTGTFEIYNILSKHNIITALHKFYSIDDYLKFKKSTPNPNLFMISTGIGDESFEKLKSIFQVIECNWICIDIANGYISKLIEFCAKVREAFPNKNYYCWQCCY